MDHPAKPSTLSLGVPGFTYVDLYRPERLRDLHDAFLQHVGGADPDLLRKWNQYRADPDAPRPAPEVSLLYVRMAPYLSGFLARLFGIGDEAGSLAAATAEQDVLFRFKADFVRRRVVPLLKGGQPVTVTDAERELVESLVRGQHPSDGEMALASAGCLLLDREVAAGKGGDESERTAVASGIEAMRKWCAARLHVEPYRSWVVFKLAGNVDYFKLVEVEHRHADLPTAMEGPEAHLRHRDGFTLTDPRMTGREVLSEINYCVLCHERAKDSCSTGLLGKDGKVQENPLGIPLEGCPLDERISEMHMIRKRGDAVGALALVAIDNPMCAGHRPPHLQRLHEGLHLPEAGAGQHPPDRDGRPHRRAAPAVGCRDLRSAHALESAQRAARPTPCRTTARRCSSSAWGRRATRWRTTC